MFVLQCSLTNFYNYRNKTPQESADLGEAPPSPKTPKKKKDRVKSILKKKSSRRDLVQRETGDLIDGLVGAVNSGIILSDLKEKGDKRPVEKFSFTGPGLVEHGHYLQTVK